MRCKNLKLSKMAASRLLFGSVWFSCVWINATSYAGVVTNANDTEPCMCLASVLDSLYAPVDYIILKRHNSVLTLVVELRGVVRAFEDDNKEREQLFMDISGKVTSSDDDGEERGLLSVALHPDYSSSSKGRVFAYYITTIDAVEYSYVTEFEATDDLVDLTSEKILLRAQQPGPRGNGGQLLFGDDGYLYIFTGDGTGHNDFVGHAQDPQSMLGKALRIDVDRQGFQPGVSGSAFLYAIPPDNPFVNDSSYRAEIFALGLRNPWRCSQDNKRTGGDGAIYCGDTGTDRFDEINLVSKGRNYGWNLKEGDYCYHADNCSSVETESAIYAYPYNVTHGSAVVGGYVYRGGSFSHLVGYFVYGDAVQGKTHILKPNSSSNSSGQTTWSNLDWPVCPQSWCPCHARKPQQPHLLSFALDSQGELLMLTATDFLAQHHFGSVLRVVPPTGTAKNPMTCGCSDIMSAALMTCTSLLIALIWNTRY